MAEPGGKVSVPSCDKSVLSIFVLLGQPVKKASSVFCLSYPQPLSPSLPFSPFPLSRHPTSPENQYHQLCFFFPSSQIPGQVISVLIPPMASPPSHSQPAVTWLHSSVPIEMLFSASPGASELAKTTFASLSTWPLSDIGHGRSPPL